MPLSVSLLSEDGAVVFANAETENLTGYERDQIEGRAFWQEAVHPEDAWKLMDAFRKGHRGEQGVVVFRFLSQRGGPRLAEMHFFPSSAEQFPVSGDQSSLVEAITFDVTERSEVREALYQSEALYRIFLEQSPIGMLHLDAAGTVTFENHQFRQIIGEGAEDAWIGRSIFSIAGLDERITPLIRQMLDRGDSLSGEMASYRRSTARSQQLKFHGSPIRHPDGGIVGGVIMVEDRTAEMRQKEELHVRSRYDAGKAELRKAALSGAQESAFLDEAARILGRSSAADRVYLLVSNAAGDCCTDRARWSRTHADEPPQLVILQRDHPILRTMEPAGSLHARRNDTRKEVRDLLDRTGAMEAVWMPFWDDTRLGGFVVLERVDISEDGASTHWIDTEMHLIEPLIRLFETLWSWMLAGNRYRDITGAIEDCLFNFTFDEDSERRYLFLTPQIELLTGYSAASLAAQDTVHTHWSDVVVHEEDRGLLDTHDEALRAGREAKATYRVQHADGSVRWVREHATSETDAMGDVIVSGILTDVTEQKAAEQVLTEAKHQAESANRLKSAFIATMSHEIRTPMGALNGFAELLDRELQAHEEKAGVRLPPQVLEFLQAIQVNSQKLLTLVNDLFDLSNLDEGSVDIRHTTVPINDVVMRSARKVSVQLSQKSIELHVDLASSDPQVIADPRRLEQVLDVLLSNAAKFTENGSVCVRTGIMDGRRARLEVGDTGVGISDDYLDRIFEPFVQEDSRLNRQFEGSGLGLSLAKRLLDLMDGTLEVESRKANGSTFVITLPIRRSGTVTTEE